MNFFDDITKLEAKEEPKKEPMEEPKKEPMEEPKKEPKKDPKEEPKEPNNSYTELQAQITELKELLTKLTNKGDINNDN